MPMLPSQIAERLQALKVLVVDDEPTMRRVTKSLLQANGVKTIFEAGDGRGGLDAICRLGPDVVILDWSMPSPNGPEFMRQVRSPGNFPYPDIPVIMLTGYGERSHVVEAVRVGVNEFLLKPVSSAALRARLVSILTNPRQVVKKGNYYGPAPRKLATYKPESEPVPGEVVFLN